jgi:hypothetical protein
MISTFKVMFDFSPLQRGKFSVWLAQQLVMLYWREFGEEASRNLSTAILPSAKRAQQWHNQEQKPLHPSGSLQEHIHKKIRIIQEGLIYKGVGGV